jgi:hypothetical protein
VKETRTQTRIKCLSEEEAHEAVEAVDSVAVEVVRFFPPVHLVLFEFLPLAVVVSLSCGCIRVMFTCHWAAAVPFQ